MVLFTYAAMAGGDTVSESWFFSLTYFTLVKPATCNIFPLRAILIRPLIHSFFLFFLFSQLYMRNNNIYNRIYIA